MHRSTNVESAPPDVTYSVSGEPLTSPLNEDRSLLEGFRRGDKSALEQVYRAHVDQLTALFRRGFSFESSGRTLRFVGTTSSFQIEDWVHEVFLRAFSDSARRQYDGFRPYGPYLERMARNLVLDELRRKEHTLRCHVEELPEPGHSPDFEITQAPVDPEERARQKQLEEHVAVFVRNLPPREHAVYRYRFEAALEQRDVAELVGLSVSKVKTSEKRIREGFRAHLVRHGWIGPERRSPR